MSSKTFIKTIPLSKGQIPLLSHDSMFPNNTCYNESFAWHIYSKLDIETVQNAFIEFVKRHECYRTVFIMEEEPVQKVYSEPVLDFKSIAVGDWGESAVNQYLLAESQESFDLSNGPLFKVRLLCFSEEHYVLYIVLHHIVFDGWSLSLILDEFGLLYKRLYNGDLQENTQLQCVEFSYSDFVSWQESLLQSEAGQTSAQFWKHKLSGELPVLELPADKKRPPVPAFAGGLAPFALEAKTSEKLSAFCNKVDKSLNRVLLALYSAFLHRLSGQNEIIVGTPRYGRKNRNFHHSCGYFVNLLPIRMRFSENDSFKQLLLQVQEELTDCTNHQDYPFSLMVSENSLQRDMSIPAVFQAGFVLQKACKQDAAIFLGNATNVFDLHGLKLAPFPLDKKVSKFDLTLFVEQESNGTFAANFEYNKDIFHEDSIQRWIRHFDHFIQTVLDNAEERMADIRLLSQDEEQQQLVAWNRTKTAYPRDQVIQELFEEQAAARPEAVAVVDEERQLTYGELNARANQLAHCLRKKGVKPETLVGICMERSADLIVGIMGILKAGGAYVPMDPSYPQQRLTYMAHDAGIELLVTQSEASGWVQEPITRICLDSAADQKMLSQESDRNPPVMTTSQNAAYVMYTSGSTGNPKGVVVEQRNVVRLVKEAGYIPLSAEDRMAQTGAIGFDASTFEVFGALLNGGSLYPIPRETLLDAPALAAFVHRHQLTTMWLTSPLFNQLVQKDAAMFAGLQHLIIGGDALSPVHVNQVLRASPELSLWNGYGPTENTTFSTCFLIDRAYEEQIPIGKPIGNSTAYVVNQHNHLNPVGVPGELCLGGDGVARGYLNQPDLTADKFVSNPFVAGERMYRTGDWVKWMPDGNLVYLGRMDKQVKIRGFRIEVGEIEAILNQHPTLRQATVVVREDRPGEKQLAAYLVGEGSVQEWRAYLSERLPSYMVPTFFVQLDSLPITPNGKIDTRALPIPTVSSWSHEDYAAPQTPAEELVAAVWSQLLGVERIGIYDSFFDLGGHSLLATQAVSRLREVFGVEVAVRDLFQHPTIESLSRRLTLLAQGGEGAKRPPIQAVERGVNMPASYAQQRLWFLDQLEPNSPLYNIPCAWRLQGAWKLDALEQAYHALIQRHEALRTVIGEANGEPVQIIREHKPERLPVTDLRYLASEDRECEMKSLMQAEADKPFQLAEGPLIRAQAIAMGENDWVLLCTLHHIIFDGWSLDIFVREWLTLYEAFAGEQPAALAPLSLQYADYAHWQRSWMSEDVMNRQLAYWEEELGGELPVLQLPTDRPRPAQQSYRGERYETDLPAALLVKLKALSRQEGATLFMTLLAAYQGFLSRYTGQTDITVGSPIANRHYGEIEEMIGFFVNTLVYRADVSANPSFRELVSQVRGKAWKAQEHQDIPFEKIVAALQPERSASYAPLFQTMFTLQSRPSELPMDSDRRMDTISSFMSVSKFDLTLGVQEAEEGMRISFEYSTDLFDASTIERMAAHFERWLHEVVEHPERAIGQMQLISEAETKQQLEIWNRTETAYPRDQVIQELFEEQVAARPEAVAVVDGDRRLTYGELNARANQLAHCLRKKGVKPETLVGICMERSADLIVGIMGILKAGGAYVPMDPSYPQQRLTYMAHDAGIEFLVTQSEACGWVPEPITRICLDSAADQEMLSQESDWNPPAMTTPQNAAYVMYTSGSTGNPKGVVVEQRNVVRLVKQAGYIPFSAEDRMAQTGAIGFDASTFEVFGALLNGGSLYPISRETLLDAPALAAFVHRHQLTTMWLTSPLFNQLVQKDAALFAGLQHLIIGGDALSPVHVNQVLRSSPELSLWNGYGPTENTTFSTCFLIDRERAYEEQIPIGKPIGNSTAYVVNQHNHLNPVGVPGELCLGGDGVARGYLNQPDLTADKFVSNPFVAGERMYRTGDWAKWMPDGNLVYLGRMDKQVKIRGFRIEVGEIETVLSQHPTLRQASVVVREDRPGEKQLAAYLVGEGSAQEWRTYLTERLPSYMVPTYFVQLDSLPLTPNGKIDTRALPIPTVSSWNQEGYAAPQTPAEELVAAVWSQLLGVERIGSNDSFFDLGGHSLLATQAVSRLREVFGVEVAVRDLFQYPTIESLSRRLTLLAQGGEGEKRPPIQAVERGVHMPVSYAQQRLWFLDQLEPNSPLYNIPCAWRLQGAWKLDALEQAYDALIQRHEVLRTVIGEANGEPVQIIREHQPERLPVTNLRHLAREDREREMKSLMQAEADKPFQLAEGPLIRAQAIAMGENDWVLMCTLHHIIFDGWSLDIFVREWLALYEAFAGGQPAELAPLSLQYADYAHWQRNWLSEDVMNRQLAYWEEELGGELPVLQLPTDRPRPAQQTYRGERYEADLPADLLIKLKALSRQEGATLFMTMLAAYQGFLSRYTGQTDIAVGSPIANRHYGEIEEMIGFFVNTLVHRADVSANPSFRELVSQVRGKAWKAQEHQDIPFEKIVAALQPERSASYAPLFQTMFTLQNRPSELPVDSECRMDTISSFMSVSKFDLTVGVQEVEEGMRVSFEYSTDLFDASTIERMAVHFERWLHEVAEHPERSIGQMQLISEAETKQQLEIWNRTETAYPRDPVIQELFEEQAAAQPEAVAVVDEDRQLTYGELNARANQLAHYLRKKGVKPETLVGICMERSADLIVGILGILKAGGAYVPMDPSYPQQRLTYMAHDAGIELMVTQSEASGWVPEPITRICLDSAADQEMLSQESDRNPSIATTPHNMAYLIYTSGTTGNPKGVMVEHHTLINMVFWHQQFYQVTEQDRVSQIASIAFDAAVAEIWPCLSRGASLYVCKESVRTDPEALQDWVVDQQITISFMPTQMAEIMIHLPWPSHTSLRCLLTGGDLLRQSPPASLPFALINNYGPTECTVIATATEVSPLQEGVPPIGGPIANTKLYVLDRHQQPVPIGVVGELYIGGAGVTRGYLNRPELTEERFLPDPFSGESGARMYRTGDAVKYQPDGNLIYVSRIDDQVKIRGFRIELGEIEMVLSQVPAIKQAVVIVREDKNGEKQLAAYLVGEGSAQEWRTYLSERLPSYMVPTYFVQLDSLPLTPNGKIDTRALPIPTVSSQEGYAAPQTPAEELVSAVWSQLLGVERIGIYDSFFELGGHSLLAAQAVSRLREVFGVEVAVRDLFQHPTIESLSRQLTLLAQGGEGEKRPPIQAVERGVHMPASYAQQRLWFLDQLEPNSPLYNIPCAWRLQGAWKLEALEQAYDALLQRHEALRTVIGEANGEPVQIIREHQPERLPMTDLRHLASEDREREMKSLMQEEADKPFQLAEGPLIRAQAIAMGENDWVLLCTLHHIIFDGWSLDIFVREWLALYEAFAGGQPAALAPLSLQYADYAHWQRNWLSEDVMNRQLAYWEEELGGELPVLQLPTDRPRPAQQSYRGELYEVDLPAALLVKLKALSRQEGATLFMTLLAAYQGFLSRYTGQTDIAVGSPIANRHYEEIEGMIGFFVNTLVYRADVSANPSFRELVSQVRGKAWKAQEHQDIPFEKIVAALQPERSASYAPLFQTVFTLQSRPSELPMDSERRMDTISSFMSVAKFDLTVGVQEVEEGMRVSFEYSTDLFDASTIERMAVHFERWLHEVAEHPERSIGQMQLISEAETKQQLEIWNRTETAYPRDPVIQELFEEQAAARPEAVAVVDEDRQLTYGELNARANQLAHYLRKKGVKPETLVGICMERSADLIVGILGILKAGGAYVPMDPSYPQQRLTYMTQDAGIELMVTQSETSGWVPEPITRICLDSAADQEMLSQESDRNPSIATTPHNMAYLIYTSGTTGNPKGVMVEHHTLINMVFWHQQFFQVTEQDRASQIASIAFDAAVAEIWPYLSRGASLHVCKESVRTDPAALQNWVVEQQITIGFMPTQMAEIMIHLPWPSHTSLRCLLTAGDMLRQSPPASLPFALINNYGPTECTVVATATEVSPLQEGIPPIGGPIANTKLYVLDPHQQPVPIGVAGELYIGGAGVTRGYLNRPELTKERFLPDPFSGESGAKMYRTGDAVKYQPEGNLIYVSRIDDQVKIRGFRIELGEIEMVLSQLPAIKQAVVIVREDRPGEKQLAAYLVGEGSAQEWRTYLSERLPSYMVPTYFVQLDSLPLTPNGKIDTKSLPKIDSVLQTSASYIAPRHATERKLVQIWSSVLGMKETSIGVHDSFFDLGGHSMKIMEALAKGLTEGWHVTVKDYYDLQTIQKIAQKIDHGSKKYLHSDTSRLQFLKPPKKDIAHATYDPIGNVLLTGVTGYLGIHLLAELLDGTNSRVYCLIRGSDPRNRLLEQISFYFHDKFEKYKVMLSSRVVIVKGDLSEKQFGLSDAEYAQLDSTINSVIHSAALTKHFGNYADFEKANVTTLEELISFVGRNKRLHYMSTMSVSGHITFGEEQHVFTENDFYVQQNYEDNVYVKSKFWAEHALFQAISNGVDAAIYRVGNLTNRHSDGQHQHNIADNAFMSRFKFMLQHGVASNQFISNDIEFTPVDACSRAVVALIKADASAGENYVFHLYNHHKVGLGEVVQLLYKSGHAIELLDGAAFQDLMLRLSQDDKHIHDIQMLMAAGEQLEGDYAIVKHDSLQTQIALSKAGFYWPKIDALYMQKIVTYLQNSGYLPVNEMRSLIQHV